MNLRFDRDRMLTFGHFLWQRFLDDKCFETAGALSYTTLVSLVPLTVVVLTMFAAFPMFEDARDTLINFVFSNFVPAAGETVQNALIDFASNARKLTGISILVMLFSAVSMMISIEDRLNRIWNVHIHRPWGPRLLLYWAALTLGPVLVVGGIALTSYVAAVPMLRSATESLGIAQQLLKAMPFVVTFLTLWLLYTTVPNRRVNKKHTAMGAVLGALLFEIARWGFTHYVRHAQNYQEIYGALAIIPLLLLWIYLSWVIVILCASMAASVSAFEYQKPCDALPEGAEFLGLLVVLRHFIDAQRAGRSVDPTVIRAAEPCLRSTAIVTYFEDLSRAGLIQRNETGYWLLTRSLDSTDLLHVYRHNRYRMPLNPVEQAASAGIELPSELLSLLAKVANTLHATMGTHLDKVYPVNEPAMSRRLLSQTQESET
ncbi:YihY family inner membrane protein [Dyella sp. M7H15-1]|uniref:YihY family inner membrane protein n=1 Tax=Dyella sp. M7H15-1 TaxID=2501295 RepID=UPI0010050F11|nr:YihY family inner membrane protein [Dyella sp. M7H15-1]QAU25157.1 YihY family inner membrane protein [Dyella sp. M7H15-1]